MGWFDRRKYSIALRLWHGMHARRCDKCAEKHFLLTVNLPSSIFILDRPRIFIRKIRQIVYLYTLCRNNCCIRVNFDFFFL